MGFRSDNESKLPLMTTRHVDGNAALSKTTSVYTQVDLRVLNKETRYCQQNNKRLQTGRSTGAKLPIEYFT